MKRKKTIFTKLMVTHLVVILISIAVLGVLLSQMLKTYFLNIKEEELVIKGQEISQITGQYLKGDLDEKNTIFLINSLERFIDARVWVIDKNGLIRMVSQENECGPRRMMMKRGFKLPQEETLQVLQGNVSKQVGETPHFTEPMVSIGVPITEKPDSNGEVIGAVFLHAPVTGVNETVNKVYTYLLFSILIAVILSSLLAIYLSRSISKPLHEITGAALAMAKGGYQTRVLVETDGEIGELASSFNYMGEKLSEAIDALHQEKSKIESLVSSLNEGVLATDKKGVVVRVNPMAEKIMKFGDHPVGRPIGDCCPSIAAIIGEVLQMGNTSISVFKRDTISIAAAASPIIDSKGNISGTVCVLQDISEAEKLEQMRKDFVSDVSHELRTPLTAIRGYNEALSDGTVEDNSTRQKYHNIIREETQRLERLIQDLLDLSRLHSGRITLDKEPLDLGAVIKSAAVRMETPIDKKGISLEVSIPEGHSYVMGNEDRIVQLIIILLDNALHYTERGGKITVSLQKGGRDELVLNVVDTGQGIPEEDIPFIFERFYKADKSRTRTSAGTGLGLAIARQIVELHNGEIKVTSQPGQGTTFRVSFHKSKE